jgi:glucan 1,3-beta-glucosidase
MTNLQQQDEGKQWIRGVNLGGWLVMERYITPYQFAITDCHLHGELCWYPGAISAPDPSDSDYHVCDFTKCKPAMFDSIFGYLDYPVDEWHLAAAFNNTELTERWINHHFDHFLTRDDLILMKQAGLTHLRVPLPHWTLGNVAFNEPWVPGDRWKYFVRMCKWARDIGLEVWPNLHTAPGSQNGFDVSCISSCEGFSFCVISSLLTFDVDSSNFSAVELWN